MRRGEAPAAAVADGTCVLGHAWQDGRVLCPICGFGRRDAPAGDQAEAVTVTAVVAMPAARAGEVQSSSTVSADGHWAWDGDEWVPASMTTIGATVTHAAAAAPAVVAPAADLSSPPAPPAAPPVADIPVARNPFAADEETSTWTTREIPRSLHDPETDRDHVPTYDDSEPAPIPMPYDLGTPDAAEPTVPEAPDVAPVDEVAAAAAETQTLEDLARLLALADVPADEHVADVPAVAPVEPVELAAVEDAVEAPVESPVPTAEIAVPFLEPVSEVATPATPLAPVEDAVPADLAAVATAPVEVPTVEPVAEPAPEATADAAPAVEPAAEVPVPAPNAPEGDAFLEPYLEFEGPDVPLQTVEQPAPEPAETAAVEPPASAASPTSVAPISMVIRPAAAAEQSDDADDDEPGSGRTRRQLRAPDVHLSPNVLRAAVVVIAAVVSTVVATGHSPLVHHTTAAPKVDTVLQQSLHSAATLETRYASEHGNASLSAAALTPGGYRAPDGVHLTVARTSGQGYCLVGSGPLAGAKAYELWDSARGGLRIGADGVLSFPTAHDAQAACRGAGAFSTL